VRGMSLPVGVDAVDRLEVPGQCPRYEGEIYWDMRVQKFHVPSGIHALSLALLYHITDYCNSFITCRKECLPSWVGHVCQVGPVDVVFQAECVSKAEKATSHVLEHEPLFRVSMVVQGNFEIVALYAPGLAVGG